MRVELFLSLVFEKREDIFHNEFRNHYKKEGNVRLLSQIKCGFSLKGWSLVATNFLFIRMCA